ncbi:putative nucleoside diphosphatase [Trypanosoma grayi]|uniref:putative nucleoside diphosphatase n=1 Tax=Trypanosoma grayi TaxID=71804 RepID=UPI0004F435CE|nr:putative nucleoside diphosphatase [Trypanosoma grayi]KEG13941.1 putative nucleoside diphosphatase [Trypanosoma grayi]
MYRQQVIRRATRVRRRKYFLLLLLIIAVLCFFAVAWCFSGGRRGQETCGDEETGVRYDVVLDAGSTGTRVHIFQYRQLRLERETFNSTRPGLSSLANDDPGRVAELLHPLMETALQTVPPQYRSCTRVTLKATAGLRLLDSNKGELLLHEARSHLRQHPFVLGPVSIISGEEEGVAAWLSVSYLLGRMPPAQERGDAALPRITTIDMGGASAQIVLPLSSREVAHSDRSASIYIGGAPVELYHCSFLGFGLKQATLFVMQRHLPVSWRSTFPCFPAGYRQTIVADGESPFDVQNVNGSLQDFDTCARLFRAFVAGRTTEQRTAFEEVRSLVSSPLPSTVSPPLIYAFSYFYDRIQHFVTDATVTVGHYKTIGMSLCRSGSEHNVGTMCMDLAYLYTFLSTGLGLPDKAMLRVPKKLRDVEVSWALGTSLLWLMSRS